MANCVRTTVSIDKRLLEEARSLNIDISVAARQGIRRAIRAARIHSDRDAYRRMPEQPDPFWEEVKAWPAHGEIGVPAPLLPDETDETPLSD